MKFEKTGDMRVRFFSSQPGKCANEESACTGLWPRTNACICAK